MKFGILKSKIEKQLLESYSKGLFKSEMKYFKKLVLENKNIKKLFFLYDELSSNKGMDKDIINDYINECVTIYENIVNKIDSKSLDSLTNWVSQTESENNYEVVDNLFNTNIMEIETKVKSRKIISETLSKPKTDEKQPIQLPISTMVNLANKTIKNYIETLNESDKQELMKFLSMDSENMENEFKLMKEEVINKLTIIQKESDDETSVRINETIDKIESEKFNKLSFFRLKGLNENL